MSMRERLDSAITVEQAASLFTEGVFFRFNLRERGGVTEARLVRERDGTVILYKDMFFPYYLLEN